jgi:hypothetical protein
MWKDMGCPIEIKVYYSVNVPCKIFRFKYYEVGKGGNYVTGNFEIYTAQVMFLGL